MLCYDKKTKDSLKHTQKRNDIDLTNTKLINYMYNVSYWVIHINILSGKIFRSVSLSQPNAEAILMKYGKKIVEDLYSTFISILVDPENVIIPYNLFIAITKTTIFN